VVVHELIQEVSDYLILVRCGFGRWTALGLNVLVACSAFGGFLLAMLSENHSDYSIGLTLAFSAGFFCYVVSSFCILEIEIEKVPRVGIETRQ
jgi:zinc transporter ZupT